MTTHDEWDEWRVVGTLPSGKPYDTPYDTEAAARGLIAIARQVGWKDGPRLQKRTVTVTVSDWQEIEP